MKCEMCNEETPILINACCKECSEILEEALIKAEEVTDETR